MPASTERFVAERMTLLHEWSIQYICQVPCSCSTELTIIQPLSQVLSKLITSSVMWYLRKSTAHLLCSFRPLHGLALSFALSLHFSRSKELKRPWPPWFSSSLAYTHIAHLFSQPAARHTNDWNKLSWISRLCLFLQKHLRLKTLQSQLEKQSFSSWDGE